MAGRRTPVAPALVMAGLAALWSAPVAEARAVEMGCLMRGDVRFSPGVTGDPQHVEMTVTGSLFECQGSTPHAGAEFRGATTGKLSCGGGDAKGAIEITWDGRNNSVVDLTADKVDDLPPTFRGKVARGAMEGRAVEVRIEAVDGADPADCAKSRGITALGIYGSADFSS
ncbi:hypothetical protein [Streptoalloteichus hindustanus]|uniref:Neocarzinostatin family protein n=1 Tax=Streptoalloteichus hindustanus TaxID=2017 RepID=A0A1M5QDW7_STRHI|nr:hypothetical protein [Streptoalloteichus hindustanus]SHH12036.1 hypothetical protein SAMN05444320_12334 [Streptoalloteichus hindustanus]